MRNIIFEGNTGSGKTTIIKKLKEVYEFFGYKVGYTKDLDSTSPYFEILSSMYKNSPNMKMNKKFKTSISETFLQSADLMYSLERILDEKNDINFFDRYIFSVLAYQEVLFLEEYSESKNFFKELLNTFEKIIPRIDLIIFFKINFEECIKRVEKRDGIKIKNKEKELFKKFENNLEKLIYEYAKKKNIEIYIVENGELDSNEKRILKKLLRKEEYAKLGKFI